MDENTKKRKDTGRLFSNYSVLLFFSFSVLLFFNISAAQADHGGIHIVPTPGETCQDDECRQKVCPQSPVARSCVQGKCVVKGGNPATETLPCNYTLDDMVLSGIRLAQFIFGIAGALMLMFIAYGGYQFLVAMANPEKIEGAKKTLTAALIGFILIIAATILVRFVAGLIGVEFGKGTESGLTPVIGGCVEGSRCPEGYRIGTPPDAPCREGYIYCELKGQ